MVFVVSFIIIKHHHYCQAHLRMVFVAGSEMGTSGGNSRVSLQFITWEGIQVRSDEFGEDCSLSFVEIGGRLLTIGNPFEPRFIATFSPRGGVNLTQDLSSPDTEFKIKIKIFLFQIHKRLICWLFWNVDNKEFRKIENRSFPFEHFIQVCYNVQHAIIVI